MIDRKKVIKEAEEELEFLAQDEKHRLHMGIMMKLGWIYDVLALLKEQEPIEPTSYMDGLVQRFACGKCGKHLLYAK